MPFDQTQSPTFGHARVEKITLGDALPLLVRESTDLPLGSIFVGFRTSVSRSITSTLSVSSLFGPFTFKDPRLTGVDKHVCVVVVRVMVRGHVIVGDLALLGYAAVERYFGSPELPFRTQVQPSSAMSKSTVIRSRMWRTPLGSRSTRPASRRPARRPPVSRSRPLATTTDTGSDCGADGASRCSPSRARSAPRTRLRLWQLSRSRQCAGDARHVVAGSSPVAHGRNWRGRRRRAAEWHVDSGPATCRGARPRPREEAADAALPRQPRPRRRSDRRAAGRLEEVAHDVDLGGFNLNVDAEEAGRANRSAATCCRSSSTRSRKSGSALLPRAARAPGQEEPPADWARDSERSARQPPGRAARLPRSRTRARASAARLRLAPRPRRPPPPRPGRRGGVKALGSTISGGLLRLDRGRDRARGRELHLLVDRAGPHVEHAAEDAGKGEHVVDLVRIVGAARRDERSEALDLLRGDLRRQVGHREHDRVVGHPGRPAPVIAPGPRRR